MKSLLQTIESTPEVVRKLIEHREENNRKAIQLIENSQINFNEIIIVGSGSSLNEAKSAKGFLERVIQLRVTVETSNDFMYNHSVFNQNCLYIFMSQSGTSETTRRAQSLVKNKGCKTIAITSETKKYLAAESCAYIDSMAANEEYLCVTLGFCASVCTLMLFGLSYAEYLKKITVDEVEVYIKDLDKAIQNYPNLIQKTKSWYSENGPQVMDAEYYAVYGSDDMWGVALEGALKILEIPKLFAVGYELEDGMHGPTMAFDKKICLFILDDKKREHDRATSLARFVKEVFNNGFVIGPQVIDKKDLCIVLASDYFQNIEYACVVQTICWFMSISAGIDLTVGRGVGHISKKYFSTHSEINI